MFEL
jgi:hypothetical protein